MATVLFIQSFHRKKFSTIDSITNKNKEHHLKFKFIYFNYRHKGFDKGNLTSKTISKYENESHITFFLINCFNNIGYQNLHQCHFFG